jgi:hypothetical protein
MNIHRDFDHAEEYIKGCTETEQMQDFFLDRIIKLYFDEYIEKYYGDERRKRKPGQIGTNQEIYRLIHSKEDVINRQNSTKRAIANYEIKFERGDCNAGCLKNAVTDIEREFSQYIIALRKLISSNSKEFKCPFEEMQEFLLASFRYEKEIKQRNNNIDMM